MKNIFINKSENRLKGIFRILIASIFFILIFSILFLIIIKMKEIINIQIPRITFDFLVFLVVLSVVFSLGKYIDKRSFLQFGFKCNKNTLIDFLFGFFIVGFIFCLLVTIQLEVGYIYVKSLSGFNLKFLFELISFIFVGVYEELIFRGYYLLNLSESIYIKNYIPPKYATILAIIISALLFSLSHLLGGGGLFDLFTKFILGVILALSYVLAENIFFSISIHISFNFFGEYVFSYGGEKYYFLELGLKKDGLIMDLVSGKFELMRKYIKVIGGFSRLFILVMLLLAVVLWSNMKYGGFIINTDLAIYNKEKIESEI
ncbi:MAG: CPBP family intramembrane glutamic endopeptidase [Bacillota bacterium]